MSRTLSHWSKSKPKPIHKKIDITHKNINSILLFKIVLIPIIYDIYVYKSPCACSTVYFLYGLIWCAGMLQFTKFKACSNTLNHT